MAVGIRSEGAAAIRGIPRLTLGMAGDLFGDLFRRLIKPLFGYLLFVRFNELSLVKHSASRPPLSERLGCGAKVFVTTHLSSCSVVLIIIISFHLFLYSISLSTTLERLSAS